MPVKDFNASVSQNQLSLLVADGERALTGGSEAPGKAQLGRTTNLRDINSGLKQLNHEEYHEVTAEKNSEKNGIFSSFEEIDNETGEVYTVEYDSKKKVHKLAYDSDAALFQKWFLQSHARHVFLKRGFFEDRPKVYFSEYTDLTHEVFWTDLASRETVSSLSHEIGLPVVRKARNIYEKRINTAPIFRVVNCCRQSLPNKQVELRQNLESLHTNYMNVGVCGSTWNCPVCSTKINSVRRLEIKKAYEAIGESSGCAYMLTFTIKHAFSDRLADSLDKFKRAYEKLARSYIYKSITRKAALKRPRPGSLSFLGYVGRVSALEVTHGSNGWHPHEHQLWFFDREISKRDLVSIRDQLFDEWKNCCLSVGLPAPLKYIKGSDGKRKYLGLDIRKALSASDYLTKFGDVRRWSIENELASSNSKRAKKSGNTPFQLLENSALGDSYATDKFVEFSFAFKGRCQVSFSRSLKKYLREHCSMDVDDSELGDQVIAESSDLDTVTMMKFTDEHFQKIVTNNLHAQVLIIAKHQGVDAVKRFLDGYFCN